MPPVTNQFDPTTLVCQGPVEEVCEPEPWQTLVDPSAPAPAIETKKAKESAGSVPPGGSPKDNFTPAAQMCLVIPEEKGSPLFSAHLCAGINLNQSTLDPDVIICQMGSQESDPELKCLQKKQAVEAFKYRVKVMKDTEIVAKILAKEIPGVTPEEQKEIQATALMALRETDIKGTPAEVLVQSFIQSTDDKGLKQLAVAAIINSDPPPSSVADQTHSEFPATSVSIAVSQAPQGGDGLIVKGGVIQLVDNDSPLSSWWDGLTHGIQSLFAPLFPKNGDWLIGASSGGSPVKDQPVLTVGGAAIGPADPSPFLSLSLSPATVAGLTSEASKVVALASDPKGLKDYLEGLQAVPSATGVTYAPTPSFQITPSVAPSPQQQFQILMTNLRSEPDLAIEVARAVISLTTPLGGDRTSGVLPQFALVISFSGSLVTARQQEGDVPGGIKIRLVSDQSMKSIIRHPSVERAGIEAGDVAVAQRDRGANSIPNQRGISLHGIFSVGDEGDPTATVFVGMPVALVLQMTQTMKDAGVLQFAHGESAKGRMVTDVAEQRGDAGGQREDDGGGSGQSDSSESGEPESGFSDNPDEEYAFFEEEEIDETAVVG